VLYDKSVLAFSCTRTRVEQFVSCLTHLFVKFHGQETVKGHFCYSIQAKHVSTRVLLGQDGTSVKTFASGAGDMGFKSRTDQISHTLPTTRHRCNLDM